MIGKGNSVIFNYMIIIGLLLVIAMYGLIIIYGWNYEGKPTPIGEDFSIFWTASALSLAGQPDAVYNLSKFQAAQLTLIGKTTPSKCGWYYPPNFLLLELPLALLPYLVSLGFWLVTTLLCYLMVMRFIAPSNLTILLTLAFPATFWNFFYGQNGFLSATLLGGGLLLLLNGSPILAGLVLGIMCYKPQFFLLIPIALLAGRCWRALIATIISPLLLAVISTIVFGYEVWSAFFSNIALHKSLFESGNLIRYQFVPTIFSAAMLAGFKPLSGYLLQAVVMIFVTTAIFWAWLQKGPTEITASILILAILLFSHFYCWYDLTILSLPLGWLGWEGYKNGWLPGEKIVLFIGWVMPIFYSSAWSNPQIGPIILSALFAFSLRRYHRQG
jgi:alpha-1,2-mannosyltransferase